MLSRKRKTVPKESDKPISELESPIDSNTSDKKPNGESEASKEVLNNEQCSLTEEPVEHHEGKVRGELKPPRVLEVSSLAHVPYLYLVGLAVRYRSFSLYGSLLLYLLLRSCPFLD